MKIVCTGCKKVLGLQRPYDKHAEVEGKCTDCFQKEKEAATKREEPPAPGEKKDIKFENGLKGFLTVSDETSQLFFGELIFSGKKLYCGDKYRDKLVEHLEMIDGDDVDVTFLHSASIKLDAPLKGRRKKQPVPPPEENKAETIHYNCTVRTTKSSALVMFDNMAERMQKVAEIMADMIYKAERDKQLELSKTNDQHSSQSSSASE